MPERNQLQASFWWLTTYSFAVLAACVAAQNPCGTPEWSQKLRLLEDLVGDGRDAAGRLETVRQHYVEGAIPKPSPSNCVFGGASLHLLTLAASPQEAQEWRRKELAEASELMAVLMHGSWLEIGQSHFPFFGLMHLLQSQLEDAAPDEGWEGEWHPLNTDDHLRFRNWVLSHLTYGQLPPLVDSVHFLARADPRQPDEPSRECSVSKAMGYLASAWVFGEEGGDSLRREARPLVEAAERHVKSCLFMDGADELTFLRLLQTRWPLWWLLHTVLAALHPTAASAPVTKTAAPALAAKPNPQGWAASAGSEAKVSAQSSCSVTAIEATILCDITAATLAAFEDMGDGLQMVDTQLLQEAVLPNTPASPGAASWRFLQIFKDSIPVVRKSLEGLADESREPGEVYWGEVVAGDRTIIILQDSNFRKGASRYSVSFAKSPSLGIYAEPSSAADPYNMEWLQAYLSAFERLSLSPSIVENPEELKEGTMYFWRINQMFEGGRYVFAGGQGVGLAIAQHLLSAQALKKTGYLWPAPETMQFYQDKLALKQLFEESGVPAPKSWAVDSLEVFKALVESGSLAEEHFPVLLKHPYASSSRGMVGIERLPEATSVLAAWLEEHKVPCLVQQRVNIARDLRITYIGGEIIHGYWRIKSDQNLLSTATGAGGSTLDFNIPRETLAPFIRDFAARTGISIGGMDIAFPSEGGPPVVFEVSPIFDLNPEPPSEWSGRPYKEYKQTDDFMQRRAEVYTQCAAKIIDFALKRSGCLFVDIDNTINDAIKRIRRWSLPAWPGHTFDSEKAFSDEALASDAPLDGAALGLQRLARDWDITFLSARGKPGIFHATTKWLQQHGFGSFPLALVSAAKDKAPWLRAATEGRCRGRPVLLLDDLTRAHHTAQVEKDYELISLLEQQGTAYEVFQIGSTDWRILPDKLAARLLDMRLSVQPGG